MTRPRVRSRSPIQRNVADEPAQSTRGIQVFRTITGSALRRFPDLRSVPPAPSRSRALFLQGFPEESDNVIHRVSRGLARRVYQVVRED